MSVRRSTGRGGKKKSRSTVQSRKSSYVQSSSYLIGEHGNYIEIRDKDGSHVHINKEIPEMFVMGEDIADADLWVDDRPATYVEFDDHAEMYSQLMRLRQNDDDWSDTVNIVWRNHL